MKFILLLSCSAKSAVHGEAAPARRAALQGEGEGRRERQAFRHRVRGRGRTSSSVSNFQTYFWPLYPGFEPWTFAPEVWGAII